MRILMLLSTVLGALSGFAQETETNYWEQIPFLSSTSSVEQLSQDLNNLALPPIRRFQSLCALFVNNVYAGSSLTNLASLPGVSFDWVERAEVEPMCLQVKGRRIDYILTFTNSLPNWGLSHAVKEDRDRPRLFVGLVEHHSIKNRTKASGVDVFKGITPSRVSHYCFYTDCGDKWVIFTRDERGDSLRIYAVPGGMVSGKSRPPPHTDGQQSSAYRLQPRDARPQRSGER